LRRGRRWAAAIDERRKDLERGLTSPPPGLRQMRWLPTGLFLLPHVDFKVMRDNQFK
jgi:hypothetical protein